MKVYFLTSDFSMLSRCFNHWKNDCFVVLWIGKERSEYFTGKYTFSQMEVSVLFLLEQ